ncbi:MAG: hypothetical protein NT172_12920 [Planctomycetota bacterium]|nr:hypothetical protein [Planctomycetota bacterium]
MPDSLGLDPSDPNSPFIHTLWEWMADSDHQGLITRTPAELAETIQNRRFQLAKPASSDQISQWHDSHSLKLPSSLQNWLRKSNGLLIDGYQWIHPVGSIGPAIRFSPSLSLLIQPFSWYEFGNPNDSPVNFDLIPDSARRTSDVPVFVVGTETPADPPRIIASSFSHWVIQLIESGFHDDWSNTPGINLGDPIHDHYRRKVPPKLSPRLCKICREVGEMLTSGAGERSVMRTYGLTHEEFEQVVDAFQHRCLKIASASSKNHF